MQLAVVAVAAVADVPEAMPDSTNESNTRATGSCFCGAVTYKVTGELRDIKACHCSQCRKTSGNYVVASAADTDLVISDQGSLTWFQSSNEAQRGFCSGCGGNLFWKHQDKDYTSIMAGTLDLPTNLKIISHIYVADASDYHSFHENDVTYEQED